ncbi:component of IIS longevity pathway SMK-1-domain-containing protein [Mycena sanguinolenta]|nr:component of IIS longevity pathway SMK-1-domain-containing protein [Mycena sanguinolenta]
MDPVQQEPDTQHTQDALGPAPADADPSPAADTLPSSSPPVVADNDDDDNFTVAPSSTVSPAVLDAVDNAEKAPEAVHTSDLVPDEMLLDTSDPDATAEAAGGQPEDGQEWMPEGQEQDMKRVKVYELVGQRWVDQGTAFCFGQFQADSEQAHLIARSERNYNDIILSTPIRSTDVYQRQQETLIVWTEPNGADYALSFQDPEGCSEVWNFICDVQQHISSDEHTLISSSPIIGPEPPSNLQRGGQLPTPQLGIIADIERAIKGLSRQGQIKERLCEYIMQEEYFKGLIEVFHTAEDLESIENLHALCSITQTILMLNDHNLYEHILSDDLFAGIVGMLEYDPEFPNHKANYREFLSQNSHFHEPIPIQDAQMQRKIHHTYRLLFLKDVVLARALDDSTFNVLNSCIIFNQIDIITHVQQDQSFLRTLMLLFVDEAVLDYGPRRAVTMPLNGNVTPATDHGKPTNGVAVSTGPYATIYSYAPLPGLTDEDIRLRRQVIFLLQQLCAMGKNVQLPARMALFRTLVDRGLLFAVQWGLEHEEEDPEMRAVLSAGGEVLAAMLDHDAFGVRAHIMKQVMAIEKERAAGKKGAEEAETIADLMCAMIARSNNLAVQSQMGDAIKVMMDIPPPGEIGPGAAGPATEAAPAVMRNPRRDDPGTERFMEYFYRDCIHILFKPISTLPEWKNSTDPVLVLTREETNRFTYLCDLLYNFISGHNFRSSSFAASQQILARIPTLFKARDKHLQHAAFRIFRLLLKLNNGNLNSLVIKHDVFKPILDLTLSESKRDNLLSCSCHEYFDYMRRENLRDLIKICMMRHEADIRKLAETPLGKERFLLFIQRWEINNEPPPEESKSEKPLDPRWPGQGRTLDAEEEDYFNADDDEDYIPPISQQQWVRSLVGGGARGSPMPSTLKRKRRVGAIGSALAALQPNISIRKPSPSLGQLMMDYGDDEDDLLGASATAPSSSDAASSSNGPLSPPPKRAPDEDDEDNMLEALVRGKTPAARPSTPTPGAVRSGEKRRRSDGDDDEDDEMLERLTKAKKPDLGTQKGAGGAGGMVTRSAKLGDDPPLKKLKMKFGLGSSVLGSSPSTPSSDSKNGAKDGDTG